MHFSPAPTTSTANPQPLAPLVLLVNNEASRAQTPRIPDREIGLWAGVRDLDGKQCNVTYGVEMTAGV